MFIETIRKETHACIEANIEKKGEFAGVPKE